MQSGAKTVDEYIESIPDDRRKAIGTIRKLIQKNLPKGYEEQMLWGMIAYVIPLERYPETYNGQPLAIAGLASQKNYISLYLMAVYGDKKTEAWFKAEYAKTGKKPNMGKSCIRFKSLEDLPLELIGKTIRRVPVDAYITSYEAARRRG